MLIRNVIVFSDSSTAPSTALGAGASIFLGARFEKLVGKTWQEEVISFRDVIRSQYTFDMLSQVMSLTFSGIAHGEACLFLPWFSNLNENAKVFKVLAGCKVGDGEFNAEHLIANADKIVMFNGGAYKQCMEKDQAIKLLVDFIQHLQQDITMAVQDALSLRLFRRLGDVGRIHAADAAVVKYLQAMQQHILFCEEYTANKVGKTVKAISQSDIILPYNKALLDRVENGVVRPLSISTPEQLGEAGPQVKLEIPTYHNILDYYTNADMGEVDEDADTEVDSSFVEASDTTSEFGGGDSVVTAEDGIYVFTLKPPLADIEEIPEYINKFDFKQVQVDPHDVQGDPTLYKTVPVIEGPEGLYTGHTSIPGYDSNEYAAILAEPKHNPYNYPKERVCGFVEANNTPLFPREQLWFARMQDVCLDLKMFEDGTLVAALAESALSEGHRSRYLNMLMLDIVPPILQITRGYTGRVTFNGNDYAPDQGDEDSIYTAVRTCFYTLNASGQRCPMNTPEELQMGYTKGYRPLKETLRKYVDTYARNPYAWLEIVLRLLRSGEYKVTKLAVTGAVRAGKDSEAPVYFDLNEATIVETLGGLDSFKQAEGQDLVFGIRLFHDELDKPEVYQSKVQNLAGLLKPDSKFKSGYLIGVGLWNGSEGSDRVSRTYFLDIFTFVDYLREIKNLGEVPIDLIDIKYDPAIKAFAYTLDGESESDANLKLPSKNALSTGYWSLQEFMQNKYYLSQKTASSRTAEDTEYREIIESLDYMKLRNQLHKMTGNNELNTSKYGVFQELYSMSGDLNALSSQQALYHKHSHQAMLQQGVNVEEFAHGGLGTQYIINFFRLINYCIEAGIGPEDDLVNYLNAVARFMDGYFNTEVIASGNPEVEQIARTMTNWIPGVVKIKENLQALYYIGYRKEEGKIAQALIFANLEGFNGTLKIVKELAAAKSITMDQPQDAAGLYRLVKELFENGKIAQATPDTLDILNKLLKKFYS